MAFVIADRVRETSTTAGTGSITLAGAVTGYQTFASALASGDTTYYTIADQTGANWEVGIGTFTSPSTLDRTTIISSSNAGSVVTFTSATKDVFISLPSSKLNTVASGNLDFTGSGQRITGDFSGTPIANRVIFQTSTANGNTNVTAIPHGSGTSSSVTVTNGSDTANTSFGQMVASTSLGFQLQSGITGTGTYLPITFYTSASERMRIDTSGNLGLGTNSPAAKFDLAGSYKEGVVTANTSTAYTIALTSGTLQILTLTGNCTFTFPTPTAGFSFTLFLKQDATGSRTATWPATVKWPSSTAPTITSTASKGDKYIFTADGTYWWGSNAGQNYL